MARSELLEGLRHPPFPAAAQKESEAITLSDDLFKGRKNAPGFTIDDFDTLDMDDGIEMRRIGKGYELIVSIADVASLVRQDSALDKEAFRRAHTVYYPDITSSPMFPHRLSEDLFSLRQGERRLTMTITTPLDENLERGEPLVELTQFISRQKMSYGEANEALDDRHNNLHSFMSEYADLAGGLKAKRRDSSTNKKGTAGTIIEESMLVTNQSLVDFLDVHNGSMLFRNHLLPPDRSERKELWEVLRAANPDLDDQIINEYMTRGRYGPANKGHRGLQFLRYLHGTSPIRRYADVINQRGARAVILGEEPPYTDEILEPMGEYLSRVSQKERALGANGVIFQFAGSSA